MNSADIRKKFLDFFQSKGHEIVPSAPIVVKNDPTLMFTNAGMNQFKDFFLGNRTPPYPRVADTQKCLRVSGKHNDLEEVGVNTYHHTMFEMLGNWSFGNSKQESGYFKKEAIAWSWELLTEEYKIPKDRLYVSIFAGDTKEALPADDEAVQEWKKWLPEDRILAFGKKDNFWEMGDTGPCGPCTEIHVDCRPDDERKRTDGKSLVNNDHPQVIEIWNNVFIQFNRLKGGSLELLPARHVDTGMGLERLVRVLQGKASNYDTDIFSGTISETEKITGKKYDQGDSKDAVAFRVIADHLRAICFTIADAQLPSNTGAGYVIRRILRRAVRYYYSYLDFKEPLLHQLVLGLALQFKYVFPELYEQAEFVTKVVREEEEGFLRTLEKGLKRMDDIIALAKSSGVISGKDAFDLYDTYGFPVDLTRLIGGENKLTVDEAGFTAEMQQQKNRSRAATVVDTQDWVVLDEFAMNEFVGYDSTWSETKVVKYRKVKAKGKEGYQVVLEVTPFYAESGGQVGDTGVLIFGEEKIEVLDTKKENDLIIHFTDILPEKIEGPVTANIDVSRRKEIALHHSATHLLHAALREVLGSHVVQKGSLVNDDYLRFDFSHPARGGMSDEEISTVEGLVNQKIRDNIPVVIRVMPKEEALKLGAMALFGEKYGDRVRVVTINPSYSIEFCGGTHVGFTGELGVFRIVSESAVAAGVRRIEAVTGGKAEQRIREESVLLTSIRGVLKNPADPVKAVGELIAENTELRKKLERVEARELGALAGELAKKIESKNGVSFVGEVVEVGSADSLKKVCFDLKNHLENYVAILCAIIGDKPYVALGISDGVVKDRNLDAGKIIKEHIAPLIKGGGGGQKTLATAGGQDAGSLEEVIRKVKDLL
ncbi:MAG: alanine--tRNA ligase [Chitinophagaceae bacterium]|nr:alanine--tRNA ligase [Chitinophagaceae bacterium]